jgi:hypothetical protein
LKEAIERFHRNSHADSADSRREGVCDNPRNLRLSFDSLSKLAEQYALKALALLKKTPTGPGHWVATPAALAAHTKQDKDLDPLRQRDDFKKLLAELEGKTNDKTPMPQEK